MSVVTKEKQAEYNRQYAKNINEKLAKYVTEYPEIRRERLKSYEKRKEKKRYERKIETNRKNTKQLANCYVIKTLNIKTSEATPELIEMKREQLKCSREVKQLLSTIKEQEDGNEQRAKI